MAQIVLGNSAPREVHPHDPENPEHVARLAARGGEVVGGEHHIPLDPTVSNQTVVEFPDETPLAHLLPTLQHLWHRHSGAAAGWVTVVGERAEAIKTLVESHFGIASPDGPTMLVTNAGLDVISAQISGAASATAVAKWMAITANSAAAAATDTTLTGEIATAGGGLIRAVATYAHTTGASTYTLTITYTANSSDVLPVTVAKMGVFDASAAGHLVYETLLSATATLSSVGDQLTITETVTV